MLVFYIWPTPFNAAWYSVSVLWSNGLVVKALDSKSKGHVFQTIGWLQGRLSLPSFRGR